MWNYVKTPAVGFEPSIRASKACELNAWRFSYWYNEVWLRTIISYVIETQPRLVWNSFASMLNIAPSKQGLDNVDKLDRMHTAVLRLPRCHWGDRIHSCVAAHGPYWCGKWLSLPPSDAREIQRSTKRPTQSHFFGHWLEVELYVWASRTRFLTSKPSAHLYEFWVINLELSYCKIDNLYTLAANGVECGHCHWQRIGCPLYAWNMLCRWSSG